MKIRLSKRRIEDLPAKSQKQLVWDQALTGLALRVDPSGAKSFIVNTRDRYGKQRRPTVARYRSDLDLADVRKKARNALDEYRKQRDEADVGFEENDLPIEEAFERALERTKRGETSRAEWRRYQRRFVDWFRSGYPNIANWSQLRRRMLTRFLERQFKGRAPNTKRLALQPVVQTAGYMEREYNLPNVTRQLGIGNQNVRETVIVHLKDVLAFIDHLIRRGRETSRGGWWPRSSGIAANCSHAWDALSPIHIGGIGGWWDFTTSGGLPSSGARRARSR